MAGVSKKGLLLFMMIKQLFLVFTLAKKTTNANDRFHDCILDNARLTRELQSACSAEGKTFDSWVKDFRTAGDIYRKFSPCPDSPLNEVRTKTVIKFCYCYSFCGSGQYRNGCEVDGLSGRLDLGANLFASYKAICKINCKPEDKLERISTLRNELRKGTITKVISIIEGTSSVDTSESGGSSSTSISAKVGLNLKNIFSAELGISHTTEYNWRESSSTSFSREVKHEARIPVKPEHEVSVYQVIGTCQNKDNMGTVYTVNTKTLIVRGKRIA